MDKIVAGPRGKPCKKSLVTGRFTSAHTFASGEGLAPDIVPVLKGGKSVKPASEPLPSPVRHLTGTAGWR
jgi:hypothetical protein